VVKAQISVGGELISVALTIAALTSVVKSTDFSGTEHHCTDISEFWVPTLVALTIVALKSVALTSVALTSVALTSVALTSVALTSVALTSVALTSSH